MVSGLPLNVPTWSYTPIGDGLHHLVRAADRTAGHTAAQRLGQAHDVGLHAEQPGDPTVVHHQAGLHLVEGQQRVVATGDLAHALEVAGLRRDDARVHHHRLEDHARRSARDARRSTRSSAGRSLNGTMRTRSAICCGTPEPGTRCGASIGPELVGRAEDRDHRRVVVTVVGALDLHHQLAAGDRAHQVERVHRGLGARVGEPPHRQTEPLAQRFGDDVGVLGRLGEVGAQRHPPLHGLDHGRMRVADDVHAVAAVHVDVLGAVDVPHASTEAAVDPHRHRTRAGPTGRHAAGHAALGPLPHRERPGHAGHERGLLALDQLVE